MTTQPKLTPAQQRVYDWLGESELNKIVVWYSRERPGDSTRTKPSKAVTFHHLSGETIRLATALALIPMLTQTKVEKHIVLDEEGRTYIHPKFAPEANDDTDN